MADEKTKKLIRMGLSVCLLLLVAWGSFHYGAHESCSKSGGTLLKDLHCVNYSSLGYSICEDNKTMRYQNPGGLYGK